MAAVQGDYLSCCSYLDGQQHHNTGSGAEREKVHKLDLGF